MPSISWPDWQRMEYLSGLRQKWDKTKLGRAVLKGDIGQWARESHAALDQGEKQSYRKNEAVAQTLQDSRDL